jgi:hypothetical protein
VLVAAALLATGYFRISDPVYAFKGLRAPEPEQAGDSLVFGTIAMEGFLNGAGCGRAGAVWVCGSLTAAPAESLTPRKGRR